MSLRLPSVMHWEPTALLQQVPGGATDDGGLTLIPGLTADTQMNLLISVLVILLLFLARRGVMAVVDRGVEDPTHRYKWAKVTGYAAFVIGVLVLLQVWFTAIRSLGTFLGLLSAGVAIALRDPVANLAGWIFIMWRRPFDVGDRIQIGPNAGDVVDVRIFQFTVMEIGNWVDGEQSTGRLIHVPNSSLFTQPLANYIAGFPYLWNELKVVVTFESDWRRAKELIYEAAEDSAVDLTREVNRPRRMGAQRFLIHYRKLTPIVYTSVVDNGVLLTLRYLCRPREKRGTADQLWERILDRIDATPQVALAYPTQRINLDRETLARRDSSPDTGAESPDAAPEGSDGGEAERSGS